MKMRTILCVILMNFVGLFYCESATLAFDYGAFPFGGKTYKYRVAQTEGSVLEPAILVIYLHGGTNKGDDNEKQLLEPGVDSIANYLVVNQLHARFIVPQCPSDASWGGNMLLMLRGLIYRQLSDGLDSHRVYIFGGSMGGTGTWSMVSVNPHLFAAAMPVAGNPSKCDADSVALTPIFTVMGTSDNIMSIDNVSTFVEQIKAKGGEVEMEVEEGWTHEMTCKQSYTTRRLDWVFSHTLPPSGIVEIGESYKQLVNVKYYSIDGKLLESCHLSGIYIERKVFCDGSVVSRKCVK